MRPLTALLEDISTLEVERRAPAFRIEVYDLRSTVDDEAVVTNTINDIVSEFALAPIVGPRDFTDNSVSASISESAGDYAQGGIASSVVTLTLQDPNGTFDPFLLIGGPPYETINDARFFRNGNVIRIFEGDEAEDPTLWPNTFTLVIQGQVGYQRSRAVGASGVSTVTVRGVTREATYLGFTSITNEFTAGINYFDIGNSIAENEMGLNTQELNLSGWGTHILQHATTTLADESPIVMLARVMFFDGFLPRFQGDGKLTQQLAVLSGTVDRSYIDKRGISLIGWPLADIQAADTVTVKGLDFNLARVDQPRQVVAKANVTTGYFTSDELIEILFSEDGSQLASDPVLRVLKSVNGGFTALGGGEVQINISAPNLVSGTPEGFIGINILISTGFAPWLSIAILIIYLYLSFIPDLVVAFGTGVTISVGRALQAVALSASLLIMTALGRGQYEIEATPFEYVFPEISQTAKTDTAAEFSKNSITVSNHLIDNAETAQARAKDLLFLQQATLHPRSVLAVQDLALEPGDSFTTLDDNRVYYIRAMSRTLLRAGETIDVQMECYEITNGIENAG